MRKILATAVISLAWTAAPALAQDGGALFQQKGCVACHGPSGEKPLTEAYPKLAGQNQAYLLTQMKDIKSGARNNGQTAVMKPTIANVSEDEMKAIAQWLSQQKGL